MQFLNKTHILILNLNRLKVLGPQIMQQHMIKLKERTNVPLILLYVENVIYCTLGSHIKEKLQYLFDPLVGHGSHDPCDGWGWRWMNCKPIVNMHPRVGSGVHAWVVRTFNHMEMAKYFPPTKTEIFASKLHSLCFMFSAFNQMAVRSTHGPVIVGCSLFHPSIAINFSLL